MNEIEKQAFLFDCLQLYAIGYGSGRIAKELTETGKYGDVNHELVQVTIREAAADMRKRNEELVEEARMQQDAAIMRLHAACIESMRGEDGNLFFSEKAIKCLIMLMERRARLLGLDKSPLPVRAGAFSWLDKASPDELIAAAAKYGVKVPQPFVVPVA